MVLHTKGKLPLHCLADVLLAMPEVVSAVQGKSRKESSQLKALYRSAYLPLQSSPFFGLPFGSIKTVEPRKDLNGDYSIGSQHKQA